MKKTRLILMLSALPFIVIAATVVVRSAGQVFQASDVQVIWKWATFDDDHAVVDYQVQGTFDVPVGYLPVACPVSVVRLLGTAGNDVSGEIFTSCRDLGQNTYAVTHFFYHDFKSNPPAQVEVSIGDLVVMPAGDGELGHLQFMGTYTLDHFEQSTKIAPHPSKKVANATFSMQVNRVDFAPSMVKVDACLTFPDTRDWIAEAYLVMDGQRIHVDEWFIPDFRDPKTFESPERCYTFLTHSGVPDFRQLDPDTVSFEVEEIYTNLPECVDADGLQMIKTRFQDYGLNPQLDQSGYYCFAHDIIRSGLVSSEDQGGLFEFVRTTLHESIVEPLVVTVR